MGVDDGPHSKGGYKGGVSSPPPPPQNFEEKNVPILLNYFLNLFNRFYPFFKLLEGIMIINTKTKSYIRKNVVLKIKNKNRSKKKELGIL